MMELVSRNSAQFLPLMSWALGVRLMKTSAPLMELNRSFKSSASLIPAPSSSLSSAFSASASIS